MRKIKIILIAFVALIIGVAAFLVVILPRPTAVLPTVSPPPSSETPIAALSSATPSPTFPDANLKPPASGYLNNTKIYFASANYSYGFYPEDVVQQFTNITVMHQGDPCFILNLTLRNDYTDNDTIPTIPSTAGPVEVNRGVVWLIVRVQLFDANGAEINATDVTHALVPFYNRDQFPLVNGKTETIDIILSTLNRDIDHFVVSISSLLPIAIP